MTETVFTDLDDLTQKVKGMAEQFTKESSNLETEENPLGKKGDRVSIEQFSEEIRSLVEKDYTGKLVQIRENLDFNGQKLDRFITAQVLAIADLKLIVNTADARLQELLDNFNYFLKLQNEEREQKKKVLDELERVLKEY